MRPDIDDSHLQACIMLCGECSDTLEYTLFTHCLPHGGAHAQPEHVKAMLDCIQICRTASDFMLRGSASHASVCMAAADACEVCASSCEGLVDAHMMKCAELCRRCADHCRTMKKSKKAA